MADDNPFAKDFRYLMPFLDRLRAHAEGLDDPQRSAQLLQLLQGAPERWSKVDTLLQGGSVSTGSEESSQPGAENPSAEEPSTKQPARAEGSVAPALSKVAPSPSRDQDGGAAVILGGQFTIGSLIRD